MLKNVKKTFIASTICVALIATVLVVVANNLPAQEKYYPERNFSIKTVSVNAVDTPDLSTDASAANKVEFAALPARAPAENPVITLSAGSKKYLSIPTGYNVIAALQDGLPFTSFFQTGANTSVNKSTAFLAVDNALRMGEIIWKGDSSKIISESTANAAASFSNGYPYWKRTYYTMTDSRIVTINGTDYIVGVTHGENKNEATVLNGATYKYKNTILPDTNYADNQYSGVINGTYVDYPQAYFSFVGLIFAPASSLQNSERLDIAYDKGPIVWPSTGYLLADNSRTFTGGIRHPSMLIDGDYMYVFYIENNDVKLARSPLSALGDPSSFRIYRNGVFKASSLPTGFDKTDRSFFKKGTLPATSVLGTTNSISFSVSKTTSTIDGKPCYIGVEEYYTDRVANKVGVRFRVSTNLVDWSNPTDLYSGVDYTNASLHYAKIYNSDYTSGELIDLSNFNLVASYGSDRANPQTTYLNVSVSLN